MRSVLHPLIEWTCFFVCLQLFVNGVSAFPFPSDKNVRNRNLLSEDSWEQDVDDSRHVPFDGDSEEGSEEVKFTTPRKRHPELSADLWDNHMERIFADNEEMKTKNLVRNLEEFLSQDSDDGVNYHDSIHDDEDDDDDDDDDDVDVEDDAANFNKDDNLKNPFEKMYDEFRFPGPFRPRSSQITENPKRQKPSVGHSDSAFLDAPRARFGKISHADSSQEKFASHDTTDLSKKRNKGYELRQRNRGSDPAKLNARNGNVDYMNLPHTGQGVPDYRELPRRGSSSETSWGSVGEPDYIEEGKPGDFGFLAFPMIRQGKQSHGDSPRSRVGKLASEDWSDLDDDDVAGPPRGRQGVIDYEESPRNRNNQPSMNANYNGDRNGGRFPLGGDNFMLPGLRPSGEDPLDPFPSYAGPGSDPLYNRFASGDEGLNEETEVIDESPYSVRHPDSPAGGGRPIMEDPYSVDRQFNENGVLGQSEGCSSLSLTEYLTERFGGVGMTCIIVLLVYTFGVSIFVHYQWLTAYRHPGDKELL